ncbi:MAG: flagellin [Verrucomicrobiae bacterium]|nr:flagellin [Verrucomicrobiae bacterium]
MAVIGTNPSSLNASYYSNATSNDVNKNIKRLASGSKLSVASDDAAGVAVSSKMDAALRRSSASSESIQSLTSFSQTANGYLSVATQQLTRLSELAMKASDGTLSNQDRAILNNEFTKIRDNLNEQVTNASFNGQKLFDPNQTVGGVVSEDGSTNYNLSIANASQDISGLNGIDISDTTKALAAMTKVNESIQNLVSSQAKVNADVEALDYYSENLSTNKINIATANSRIKDLDYAEESTNSSRNSILNRASDAMLAQSNLKQQNVLQLLS